jgi:cation diffusion facilitator CzcD-associated flavoprotein CzcO
MDKPVSSLWQNIYKYIPPIRWRVRAVQMDFRESFYDAIWDGKSDLSQMIRVAHQQKLEAELPNRKDLWEKLTPKYNPGCKRIIISDDYFPALGLPNVDLETRAIDSISGNKVKVKEEDETVVDVEPDFDLLVCATGFKTVDFMHPINMYGKGGRSLRDIWHKGAQAYNGVVVEDMPNFAMLYGPNTNLGHNSKPASLA